MRRFIIISLIMGLASLTCIAQDFAYEPKLENGNAIISDFTDMSSVKSSELLSRALLFLVNKLSETESTDENVGVKLLDIENGKFDVEYAFPGEETGSNATEYRELISVQAMDGILSFTVSNIKLKFKEKGLIWRTIAYESLNISDKKRHAEIYKEYNRLNSNFIKSMLDFVQQSPNLNVTHWKEIKQGDLAKGMNEAEVKLSWGVPMAAKDSGSKTKWMYKFNSVVIFVNGKVTNFVR